MLFVTAAIALAAEEKNAVTAEEAQAMLMEGNARFASGNVTHPDQSAERREELVSGQHPFAVVVGCSDSRVPPEVLFDQGLGDIFVIRTAGQALDDVAIGSIEYAVEHLSVPLVLVLGHDSCGAVTAAVKGGEVPGHLVSLVDFIKPAVDEARNSSNDSELLNNSIDINIKNIVEELRTSKPILSEKIEKGELKVVGARYHLDSGEVEILE
ncbi:Carbonic anhydrase [uncultured archaeon]|nr:Carbonic anhydrase [uncultured archaeon]